jgi:RND family efflux transporter MFP subunit
VVAPNAYRQVTVTPLVSGRITRVDANLGDRVRRGQTIALIYSPQLAEAQTRYLSARAMLEAHDRELQRTQKLVEIGAASRQELERVHAEHAAQTAAVESARSQLELLGLPASTLEEMAAGMKLNAAAAVPAPIDGVVTERAANVGLNVDPATKLFTIVDLSSVWVLADVYEHDVSRVRVGDPATVAAPDRAGAPLRGRVSYIDPQVSPETRTAKVRIEVPNADGGLRLGMFTDVILESGGAGTHVTMIPRAAVQSVGDRSVVYLADPARPDEFVEREVQLGQTTGERVEVRSGVKPGDAVVTTGSFFVRAERERLGLRPATAAPSAGASASPVPVGPQQSGGFQTARVTITAQGFEPATVLLRAGTPARVTFLRTTDNTCAKAVAIPALGIKRALPLDAPVEVEFTPKAGQLEFACGMNMLRGSIVAK